MRLFGQDLELVHKKFNIDRQLTDRLLAHYFDRQLLAGVDLLAEANCPEGALADSLAQLVAILNILDKLELLEVFHVEGPHIWMRANIVQVALTFWRHECVRSILQALGRRLARCLGVHEWLLRVPI